MAVIDVGRAAASARPARAAVAASGLLGRLSGALLCAMPCVSTGAARADAPAPLLCCRSSGSRPWLSLCASAKLCASAPAPRSPSCGALAFWPCRRRPLWSAGPRPRPLGLVLARAGGAPAPSRFGPGAPTPRAFLASRPGARWWRGSRVMACGRLRFAARPTGSPLSPSSGAALRPLPRPVLAR